MFTIRSPFSGNVLKFHFDETDRNQAREDYRAYREYLPPRDARKDVVSDLLDAEEAATYDYLHS